MPTRLYPWPYPRDPFKPVTTFLIAEVNASGIKKRHDVLKRELESTLATKAVNEPPFHAVGHRVQKILDHRAMGHGFASNSPGRLSSLIIQVATTCFSLTNVHQGGIRHKQIHVSSNAVASIFSIFVTPFLGIGILYHLFS